MLLLLVVVIVVVVMVVVMMMMVVVVVLLLLLSIFVCMPMRLKTGGNLFAEIILLCVQVVLIF